MIRTIKTYDECRVFAAGFQGDPNFSDPMLSNEEQIRCNLVKSIDNPDRYCVFGVYREDRLIGLFAFLVPVGEEYIEMLVGLSREQDAYAEMFACLEQNYPGYKADFVFNPGNYLLKALLEQHKAAFEPEQQKMMLVNAVPDIDTTGIELFSEQYAEQYCAMHTKDMYWTAEKVMEAKDRFRIFLAIHDGKVVGYLDVTYIFQENEPYDLVVLPEYRHQGYGRKLLAKALEMNQPNDMMLLVDVDNTIAIHLYASMGFAKVQGQNNLTAHCTVPKH